MSKKLFWFALCAMLFALCLPVEAQQAGKVYRIGWLAAGGRHYDIFRQRLRELGYVEGQNLVIERRSVPAKGGRLRDRAREPLAELVRLKVDVIVITGAPSMIHAAQGATRTIPIVMQAALVDPVKAGFVDSLARRLPESILVDPEIFPVALSRTKSIEVGVGGMFPRLPARAPSQSHGSAASSSSNGVHLKVIMDCFVNLNRLLAPPRSTVK